jgi:hypothetical protein
MTKQDIRDFAASWTWDRQTDDVAIASFDDISTRFSYRQPCWELQICKRGCKTSINIFDTDNRVRNLATIFLIIQDAASRLPVECVGISTSMYSLEEQTAYVKLIDRLLPQSWGVALQSVDGDDYLIIQSVD